MKKSILFLVFFVFFTSNALALENFENTFYVGEFNLNEANWSADMQTQLMRGLSGLPNDFSVKVFGHTDESGSKKFNEKLAEKRASLVTDKIARMYPGVKLTQKGVIFDPEKGQKKNFRMVQVTVFYEKKSLWQFMEKMDKGVRDSLLALESSLESINFDENFSSLKSLIDEYSQKIQSIGSESKKLDKERQVELLLKIDGFYNNFLNFVEKSSSNDLSNNKNFTELKDSIKNLDSSIQSDLLNDIEKINESSGEMVLGKLDEKLQELSENQSREVSDISNLLVDFEQVNNTNTTEIKTLLKEQKEPIEALSNELKALQDEISSLGLKTFEIKSSVQKSSSENENLIRNFLIAFIIIQFITIAILIVCLASRKAFLQLAGKDIK